MSGVLEGSVHQRLLEAIQEGVIMTAVRPQKQVEQLVNDLGVP